MECDTTREQESDTETTGVSDSENTSRERVGERQSEVCVCDAYQGDARENLQQGDEVVPISQVLIEVSDVLPHLQE